MKLSTIINENTNIKTTFSYPKYSNVLNHFIDMIVSDDIIAYEVNNNNRDDIVIKVVTESSDLTELHYKKEGQSNYLTCKDTDKILYLSQNDGLPYIISYTEVREDNNLTAIQLTDLSQMESKHMSIELALSTLSANKEFEDVHMAVEIDLGDRFRLHFKDATIVANGVIDGINKYNDYVEKNICNKSKQKAL